MRSSLLLPLSTLLIGAPAFAQGGDFLFTTSQTETTITGSGGTVLQTIRPNEIAAMHAFPCPHRAEKWSPRSCFTTMAGDEDGDDSYFEAAMLGQVDALVTSLNAGTALTNQRNVFYSPSVAMGTVISAPNQLRPGDIGRIVRTGAGDGRVQYFLRAELIQMALGLPPTPVVIDVDAAAFSPNLGVFLSLDADVAITPCTGPTLLQDGAVFMIHPSDYTLTSAGTISAVNPGSALVVYTEAQMDAFVANAQVTDRFGACVPNAIDTEALEIDWSGPSSLTLVGCTGIAVPVPHFIFTAETLTGGSILTTALGGQIYNAGCAPLGTMCPGGPTFGPQIGLRPPSPTVGIPSYVNALASTRAFRFVAEAKIPVIPTFTPAQIDFGSPAPLTFVFLTFAPMGPGVVAPSTPFIWGTFGFPDYYAPQNLMGNIPTGTGFGTYTSPPIPFPCDLVFFGVCFTPAGTIECSTPTMVEVF
jgi:hypothetical protein